MFTKTFNNTHHKVYNLALFKNTELNLRLLKKYPNFGLMVPLTMSIWSNGSTMNIGTLSLEEIFEDVKYDGYDFYDTYSICKLDLIYSISKLHPEVGAYSPCSFYLLKIGLLHLA